ncbi:MAG TPA: hypothetical protein VGD98_16225 [Ktedonobacteraceae bacterium]
MTTNEPEPGKTYQFKRVEHPGTYVVQERENQDELARLLAQDHMVTLSMGGVFSEQPD